MIVEFMQLFIRVRARAKLLLASLALGLGPAAMRVAAESPPIVGRPLDFSGAVGGPFIAQWHADRTELTAEESITLTLRIIGPGNLADMPRPALSNLSSFKSFVVEDLDDRLVPGDPPRREFRYRVRPRSPDVKEIPRFKLVYFNPRIVPASRGYQTTYADAVPLTVKPQATAAPGPYRTGCWNRRHRTSYSGRRHRFGRFGSIGSVKRSATNRKIRRAVPAG